MKPTGFDSTADPDQNSAQALSQHPKSQEHIFYQPPATACCRECRAVNYGQDSEQKTY